MSRSIKKNKAYVKQILHIKITMSSFWKRLQIVSTFAWKQIISQPRFRPTDQNTCSRFQRVLQVQQARYDLAMFARYATGMTITTPVSATHHENNAAFVLRLSWDRVSEQWCILLKPVNGQDARLFSTVESTLVYLEAIMQKEKQQPINNSRSNASETL
jgi:hypothetical protein